ncbi:MAG TPA: hypothetical protein VM346_10855 [Sphingomicrobium sp.]|nr:hypothetical protein [Sphingomicrobium sp.]
MADEALWRRRFLLFMAARLFGLALFLGGVAIAFTDLIREGGWPLLGGILAVMGAIDAEFAPRMLRKMWEQEDR